MATETGDGSPAEFVTCSRNDPHHSSRGLRQWVIDMRRCLESRRGDCQNIRIRVARRPDSTFSACHSGKRVAEDFDHGLIGGRH